MTWFKVDDSFHSHPKVLATSPAALGLWVVAGAWSSANLTEGSVPDHALPRLLPDAEPLARELVTNGLWRRERGGYRFHDWIAYNPTRSEAIAARDKMASGGAIGNHRRWHLKKGVSDPECRYCQDIPHRPPDRPPDRVPDGAPESGANPPTRPDPSLNGGTSGGKESPSARAREEPPQRCPEHANHPNPPPCGPCADARRTWQTWETNRVRADQARQLAESQARQAARAAPTRPVAAPDAVRAHAAAARAAIRNTTSNQAPKQEDHTHDQEQRHAA